jgi:hypothetical protein
MRLTPASDYVPNLQAPFRDYSVEWEEWGRRFVCKPWRPEPYYIVLSLQKGQGEDPYYIEWQDADIGDPIIEGEWVNVLARYNPAGGQIEWEHSPSDPGWTGEPPFKPLVVGEHTITARYYAEDGEPEKSLVGYVEDKVTFRVLEAPGIHLLSDIPKDKLLIGERMPLFVRLINLDEQKQLHEIDASITFFELGKVVEEGSGEVVDTPCWRFMPCLGIPPEPLHDEYWLVFTVAGLSEGKVKLQPKVRYKLNGETAFTEIVGPQYEIEVQGFVDLRLDNVGEWGEEDPGAFMAKDGIEQLMLRTCTAGNVTLSWNSDKVGLYTDPACEQQHKVAEDEGSVEGSRRATFTPQYGTPPNKDRWDTVFKTTCLWAKALQTSAIVGDVHLTLSPVTSQAPPDLLNLTLASLEFTDAKGLYNSGGGAERDPTAGGRVYSNREYVPENPEQTVWTRNKQYVDLEVRFTPTTKGLTPGVKVAWQVEDPDDPSDEDMDAASRQIVDPNDCDGPDSDGDGNDQDGGDNTGARDDAPVWEELHEDYALSGGATRDGVSKVRFNVTDEGGDNFVVKARIKPSAGTTSYDGAETGLITVWKLIQLENTKMPSGGKTGSSSGVTTADEPLRSSRASSRPANGSRSTRSCISAMSLISSAPTP